MANAGGAWDNAKKIVETELKAKGTELHAASVVGDTVGDPFKDTSSVAMNPVIKFTTLFGLLAVELGVYLSAEQGSGLTHVLAAVFFVASMYFVWRSFYGMRIEAADSGRRRRVRPGEMSPRCLARPRPAVRLSCFVRRARDGDLRGSGRGLRRVRRRRGAEISSVPLLPPNPVSKNFRAVSNGRCGGLARLFR